MNKTLNKTFIALVLFMMGMNGSAKNIPDHLAWIEKQLDYCDRHINITLGQLASCDSLPRSINGNCTQWGKITYEDWTSGFWPGILWYRYAL